MSRIMLDVDDVLFPCVASIRRYFIDELGYSPEQLPAPTTWEIHTHWGLDRAVLWNLVTDGANEGLFCKSPPFPGTRAAMQALKTDGHTLHLVTARIAGDIGVAERSTVEWLRINRLPFDSLTFAKDKTIVAVDYALDDKVENCEALADSCRPWVMDQPWNRHNTTLRRVHSLSEFVKEIRKWEQGLDNNI